MTKMTSMKANILVKCHAYTFYYRWVLFISDTHSILYLLHTEYNDSIVYNNGHKNLITYYLLKLKICMFNYEINDMKYACRE